MPAVPSSQRLKRRASSGPSDADANRARWLHRDDDKIPHAAKEHVAGALASSPYLAKLVAMREELRLLWTRTTSSAEQLLPTSRRG